jgi:DNA repair protein RadB
MKKTERKISAGSYDLNKWLYGGYETDIITTIYGPAGSGKTNFCLLAAISQAKRNKKVIFIDTEGGFSVERVRQITGENYEEILKNIVLLKVTSFDEQKKVFARLLKEIRARGKIGLIIMDGMTMLYRLELGEAIKDREEERIRDINRELAKQMKILAEIARNMGIPVLATNQVYSEFLSDEEMRAGKKAGVRMVGGDIMKYWSKCIIELEIEGKKRKAILRKHRSLPQKELIFDITNKGVRRRGWI